VQTEEISMATQRCLWEDPERKKREDLESKDLTRKIMRDIWRGLCGSEASRPVGDFSSCSGELGSLEVSLMNKENGIKVGEPD